MNKRILIILGGIIILAAVLAVGWYLASPLFIDNEVDEAFPVVTIEEAVPPVEVKQAIPSVEAEDAVPAVEVAEATSVVEMEEEMETDGGITAVLSGNFTDADAAHKGSGTATIYQQNEALILRLQEFSVTNGPDLHVYLSTSPIPTDDIGEYIDLGELKGNIGDQNYDIPDGTDLSQYQSIIIYCQPFHVVFSTATLGA